jgi:hypothetical protein
MQKSSGAMTTLRRMNSLTSAPCSAQAFKRESADRSAPSWLRMLVLASVEAAATVRRRSRGTAEAVDVVDELDEDDWPETPDLPDRPDVAGDRSAPRDWLFWSFFMCMAIAALPLVGIRWTSPDLASMDCAFEDAVLLALPVVIPLPFLFAGCVGSLAFHQASRTPAAFGIFGVAMAIALAAAHALLG